MYEDFTICPTCKQKVYNVPIEEQCEFPNCHDFAVYEAWFKNGILNQLRRVCEEHVKLSIGWQKQQEKENA